MTRIGTMRQRIMVQKHTVVVDAIGNHTSAWVDYHTCFSYVNLASGNEYGISPETVSEDTLVFVIRWCRKLQKLNGKEYRILFNGNVYNISCVDDMQFRHETLKLTAAKEQRG